MCSTHRWPTSCLHEYLRFLKSWALAGICTQYRKKLKGYAFLLSFFIFYSIDIAFFPGTPLSNVWPRLYSLVSVQTFSLETCFNILLLKGEICVYFFKIWKHWLVGTLADKAEWTLSRNCSSHSFWANSVKADMPLCLHDYQMIHCDL